MSSKASRNNSPPKATSSPPKQQSPPKTQPKAQSPPKAQYQPKPVEKPQPVAVQAPKGKAPEPVKPPQKAPQPTKQKAPETPKQKAPEPQKKPAKVQQTPKKGAFDPKHYAKNGTTQEEVVAAKNAFDLFDTDQGGSVDIRELKAAMTSLGFQSKSGAIFQMIVDLDSDGNGTIDFQQWLNLLTKKVNDRDSRENINKIFALFDQERTGHITVQNLKRVAKQLGENVSEAELNQLIVRADLDHDGVVSEEEFYFIVTRKIKD